MMQTCFMMWFCGSRASKNTPRKHRSKKNGGTIIKEVTVDSEPYPYLKLAWPGTMTAGPHRHCDRNGHGVVTGNWLILI